MDSYSATISLLHLYKEKAAKNSKFDMNSHIFDGDGYRDGDNFSHYCHKIIFKSRLGVT